MQAERDTDPSVEAVVLELVSTLAPVGVQPRRSSRLAEIGLDSLACADLAVAIEERLGVRLPDAELQPLDTVGDAVDAVERGAPLRDRVPRGLGRMQSIARTVGGPPLRAYARLRVEGAGHVPATGPVVMASNHRSMFDIPALVAASPRPVLFMAKRELFGGPVRAWLWNELGGFPVERRIADIRSIDTALALLERGELVALYPEGTRSKSGQMLPFLLGAAWLSLHTGAPIVPCGVIGTGTQAGWDGRVSKWRGKHVRVAFGEPIRMEREPDPLARRARAEALTADLRDRLAALL